MNDGQNITMDVPKDSPLFGKVEKLFRDVPRIMGPREHFIQNSPYPEWPECRLEIKRLQCLKKNELTKDEINAVMFRAESDDQKTAMISNVVMVRHDFKKAGEVFDVNMSISMPGLGTGSAFFIMIYEKDNPALFDPDDPIGLVAFYPNQAIAAFSGNFYDFPNPLTYSNPYGENLDITLDAGNDGKYCLTINLCAD